ncbi:MAG: PAS domain-containing sensor histidine kinase [Gammaproteobacteria bacterium]|nr:PAS domain-containing sensor histidine kinase [Gammaproteobacteria bacterium]PCH62696.1 MAG: PAS domain-containing sensor histidine kinase [Gammaproteobacteria bacterium]PCH64141.1 MAG: PAS domain-containing sensor histidine kinase [Gammaproteobacteria bacterium]
MRAEVLEPALAHSQAYLLATPTYADSSISVSDEAPVAYLTRLLDALPAGVIVLDAKGFVERSNIVACDLLGEPLVGQPWYDVIRRCFESGSSDSDYLRIKGGRYVSIATKPLDGLPGQVLLISDVTEKYRLQDRLRCYKRLSTMGEVAASLAHQIRTPLSSALLYATNLQSVDCDKKTRESFLDKVVSRLNHLDNLVNSLLMFAGKGRFTVKHIAIDTLHNELVSGIDTQVNTSACDINHINHCSDAVVMGNQAALLSAIQNIIINAVQVCTDNGKINIVFDHALDTAGRDCIQIKIQDNGPGINSEALQEIFKPFYTTKKNGTGLGLAVVNDVIKAHSGEINVSSELGIGTEFIINLPSVNIKNQRNGKNR